MNRLSKFDLYDSMPESLRKSMEVMQKLTASIQPALEAQQRIQALTRPLEEISAINSKVMNLGMLPPEVIRAANEVARFAMPAMDIATKMPTPVGLSAIQMSIFQIDTKTLQIANTVARSLPPNYIANVQSVLDSYSSVLEHTIQSPFMDWLQTVDISPLTHIWKSWDIDHLLQERYDNLSKLHRQVMYKARWFPYASTLADGKLFDEITEIIYSSRIDDTVSKRCEKRIDKAILSYYTKPEIKRIKKRWNASDLEPHTKKALGQALESYLRKEYALVIPLLATMWEGIIKSKIAENTKKPKEDFKKLVDENGFDEVFSDFYNNLIIGTCYSVSDVVEGIPNRHGIAHSWYVKYPTQKAALNAILLTDFIINLKPKNEEAREDDDE